jgi:glycosyltransferase involved in cell wall biosynthesis
MTERAGRLLLVSELPPPYGGLSVHTERLCAEARRRGWEVTVATPPPHTEPRRARFRRLQLFAVQARFLARVATTPCDVLHDHVSTYSIGAAGGIAFALHVALVAILRLRRVPWILTCGNGLLPGLLERTPPWRRAVHRWLYAGVRAGIAKNEPILRAFDALGIGGRSRVVGTFLPPVAQPAGRPLAAPIESFLAAHPRCVVTAGFRFEPLYHLEAVVRGVAAARAAAPAGAPEIGLVVLASRAEDAAGKAAYDAALSETGIAAHVLLLRDADDALEVIARTRLLVRATDFDGDANTVKEAMMLGVPVLATDLPNRPPGIELVARDALATLGPRIAALLEAPDPAALARNRDFVRDDIARNAGAIFGLYAEVRRA